ncbi:MAG: carboxypeptidase regulatory-like domain-containing protein [Candidatus Omnitrophica bacterium]|nr:carboxypeptidase regulatory-like domain-containing protein [Candidatus Omnitrophota bacterium]
MFRRTMWINTHSLKILSLILFFCLVSVSLSYAALTAVVTGKVVDSATQKPLSQVTLKLSTLTGTTLSSTLTDSKGNYQLSYSIPAYYQLTCQASGYNTETIQALLAPNRARRFSYANTINFSLKPALKIVSITPADRTSFTAGDTIAISCQTNTPNRIVQNRLAQNSLVQYRFSLGAKLLKDWSTVSSYSYKTTSQDLNRHTIKVEAKDERNNTDTKSSDIFVFAAFPKPGN